MNKAERRVNKLRKQLNSMVKDSGNHKDEKTLEVSRKLDEALNDYIKESQTDAKEEAPSKEQASSNRTNNRTKK